MPTQFNFLHASITPVFFALAIIFSIFAIAIISKRIFIKRLNKSNPVSEGDFQAALSNSTHAIKPYLISIYTTYPIFTLLDIKAIPSDILMHASSAALIFQIGLFFSSFLTTMIERAPEFIDEKQKIPIKRGVTALAIFAKVMIWAMVAIMLLESMDISVTPLLAGLGIGSIALGLALQHILVDLFASFSIIIDKPFEVGHFIEVGPHSGRVESIGLKTTRIRSASGELIIFTNSDLTKSIIKNYRLVRERSTTMLVHIHPSTSGDQLKLINSILEDCCKIGGVKFESSHLKTFSDYSLVYELCYSIKKEDVDAHNHHLKTQNSVNINIVNYFHENNIKLTFGRTANIFS